MALPIEGNARAKLARSMDPAVDPSDAAEAALLAGLRAGDDDAYDTLVRANSARLLTVARRILGSDDDARDALQEAFISAFKALPRFEGHARLSTWLHRIVVNTALMKLRSRKRRPEEPIETLLPAYKDDGHVTIEPVEWADNPEAALGRAETRAFVRAQIDRLPDNYRTVLVLRDIEEMSTPEAADVMGISENAVKIRLHRARQALRALIDQRLRAASSTDVQRTPS
jgi:RNA polymerase sigma-70 factor, ECF subfamily